MTARASLPTPGLTARPPVSILIPAFNAAPTLAESLASVQAQTFGNFEAIVVDDGSRDETAAIAEATRAQDPRFHLLRQANHGRAAALNTALSRARGQWIADRLRGAPVRLTPEAVDLLAEHLGEDLARLDGLLATLESAFPVAGAIDAAGLAPFLGTAGGVAPWDLTDAIDARDVPAAIAALSRLVGPGERNPFQILALLHRHFGAMLRLDGSGITDEDSAAAATGLKPYPAKKALASAHRLGHAGVVRAISLLARADMDLRGESGWRDELVLEVLVARLARPPASRPLPRPQIRRARSR